MAAWRDDELGEMDRFLNSLTILSIVQGSRYFFSALPALLRKSGERKPPVSQVRRASVTLATLACCEIGADEWRNAAAAQTRPFLVAAFHRRRRRLRAGVASPAACWRQQRHAPCQHAGLLCPLRQAAGPVQPPTTSGCTWCGMARQK